MEALLFLLKSIFEKKETKLELEGQTPKAPAPLEYNSPYVPDSWEKEYKELFSKCQVAAEHKGTVSWYVTKVYSGLDRYKKVAERYSMPWQVVAIIHGLECSFAWDAALHNGDKIIGTGRKTYRVPAGRGPFLTWEEAAVDALNNDKVRSVPKWTIAETLYFLESYNGLAYKKYRQPIGNSIDEKIKDSLAMNGRCFSPYLWGLSNLHKYGKYVSDGNFSASAKTKQCGAGLLLKELDFFS